MVIFIFLLSIVNSKQVSTQITLSESEQWKYLTKFASYEGTGTWEMRIKLSKFTENQEGELDLVSTIYAEKKWQDALSMSSCMSKQTVSQKNQHIKVPLNGLWSEYVRGTFHQKSPYFWYFALSSCELTARLKFKIELSLKSPTGSEFSAEEEGLQNVFPGILMLFIVILWKNLGRLIGNFKKTDDLGINLLLINIAIGSHVLGIIFETIHLWVYAYNGYGITVFDGFYDMLDVFGSFFIMIVLILMADGWTVKYKDFPESDVYVPVAFIVIIINLIIAGFGKITEDYYTRNSEYTGIPGLLITLFRLSLWIWFTYLSKNLYSTSKKSIANFVIYFYLIGSLYFLSVPLLVLISWSFKTYLQNIIVIVFTKLLTLLFYFFLTYLFGEQSTFYKISTLSEGVLPGKAN